MLGHRSLSSGKKKWVKGLQSDHARKIRCIMNIQEKKGGQFPENCIIFTYAFHPVFLFWMLQ